MQKNFEFKGEHLTFVGASDFDPYLDGLALNLENKFSRFLTKYIKNPKTCIDIGANIGITSVILSKCFPRSKIFSFEPGGNIFSALEKNIQLNQIKNINCHNIALSNVANTFNFVENFAWGHLTNDAEKAVGSLVQTQTLDEFAELHDIEFIDLVKIDTEGHEPQVLMGMKKTLKDFKPVVFLEFNTWCLLAFGNNNPVSFLKQLMSDFHFLYRFRFNSETGLDVLELISDENEMMSFLHDNIVVNSSVDDIVGSFYAL